MVQKLKNFKKILYFFIIVLNLQAITIEKNIDEADIFFKILHAEFESASGNFADAFKIIEEIPKKIFPGSANHTLIRILNQNEKFDEILSLKSKSKENYEKDLEIQMIFVQSLLRTNKDKEAQESLNKLAKDNPENEQIIYLSTMISINSSQFTQALSTLDSFLDKKDLRKKHYLFYFLKAKIYLHLGNPKESLKSVNESLKLFSKFDKGLLFKSILDQQMGNIDAAIAGYKNYLDIAGSDPDIEKQLISLLFSQKKFLQAKEILKKITKNKDFNYFFDLALIDWKANNLQSSLNNVNLSLNNNLNFLQARALKIEVLLSLNKREEILGFLKEMIINEPDDIANLNSLILLTKANFSFNDLKNVLNTALEKYPNNKNLLSVLSDINIQDKNFKQAIYCYQKILEFSLDKELNARLFFQIAQINFVDKNYLVAKENLVKSLELNPNLNAATNLLSYIYAQENINLEKALELVEKILKSEPKNSAFMDTKGFVLFKLGKKAESLDILKKALALNTNDEIIKEHIKLVN